MFHTFANAPLLTAAVSNVAELPLQAAPGRAMAGGYGSGSASTSPQQRSIGGLAAAGDESNPASFATVASAPAPGAEHAVPALHTTLASAYPEWSTGDLQLDTWLQLKMQSQDVFVKLAQIPLRDRRQLVSASRRKEGEIVNMTSYIMGCIRKVASGTPATLVRNTAPPCQPAHMGQMSVPARPPASPQQLLTGTAASTAQQLHHGPCAAMVGGLAQMHAQQAAQPVAVHSMASLDPITFSPPKTTAAASTMPAISPATTAPDWVKQAMKESDKPSTFVAEVLAQLPPVLRTVLDGLQNPGLQYRLCFALVLDGQGWAAPGPTMETLLRTYSVLAPGSQIEAALGKTGGSLRLVLLHCCNGLGTSHLVIHAAMRILATSRPGIDITIVENFAFEIHTPALNVQTALTDALGVSVQQVGDIALLPLLAQQCAPRWAQLKAVICFINSWPCKNTSRAAPMKDRPPGSGLHMQHSRKMWDIDHAMHVLQQMKLETHYIAHMTEYPPVWQ